MSLRLRLVGGMVVLMAAGLTLFGLATYLLFSHSEYSQLDGSLSAAVPQISDQFRAEGLSLPDSDAAPGGTAGSGASTPAGGEGTPPPGPVPTGEQPGSSSPGGTNPTDHRFGGGHFLVAPGTYAEVINSGGAVVGPSLQEGSGAKPDLTALIRGRGASPAFATVGSVTGSQRWRAYLSTPLGNGDRLVVAVPLNQVQSSLDRLVLIELAGAACLLLILTVGTGLVVRRGLAPIERMADTAAEISAGDLARRVAPTTTKTEVGQLAQSFNTMLDRIEAAFAERDAVEGRLRQFLADASHELRTPLTSIQGFAELFRLGMDDPRIDLPTIMRRIEEESARMRTLVEDLLLLARLDQVRAADRLPVDLSVILADACSDAIAAAPDRAVTLDAPEPVIVPGDEAHLRQAVANLMTNALRHTPPGSPIDVSVRRADGTAVVAVRDHGDGLDAEALEHVFDRFWQKDPSRAGVGAGLGLAIVAAVIAEHGGQVSGANAPGGGAIFSLTLPVVPEPQRQLSRAGA